MHLVDRLGFQLKHGLRRPERERERELSRQGPLENGP